MMLKNIMILQIKTKDLKLNSYKSSTNIYNIKRTNVPLKAPKDMLAKLSKVYFMNSGCRTTTLVTFTKIKAHISLHTMMSGAGPKSKSPQNSSSISQQHISSPNTIKDPLNNLTEQEKIKVTSNLSSVEHVYDYTSKHESMNNSTPIPIPTVIVNQEPNPLKEFAKESSKPLQMITDKVPLNKKLPATNIAEEDCKKYNALDEHDSRIKKKAKELGIINFGNAGKKDLMGPLSFHQKALIFIEVYQMLIRQN